MWGKKEEVMIGEWERKCEVWGRCVCKWMDGWMEGWEWKLSKGWKGMGRRKVDRGGLMDI